MSLSYKCRGCNAAPRPEPWPPGRCPSCGGFWDCQRVRDVSDADGATTLAAAAEHKSPSRISTGIVEFDRVLGGGLVPGSTTVVTGDPGAGKSTLLLMASENITGKERTVIYTSGEQSREELLDLAARLDLHSERVHLLGNEGDVYKVTDLAEQKRPALVVIDSLQTSQLDDVHADEGSATMCAAVSNYLTAWAKREKIAVVLVAHVSKSGDLAGPKQVEHLVDNVVYFEKLDEDSIDEETATKLGAGADAVRVLTSSGKMRHGPSGVTAFLEMTERGLRPSRKLSKLVLV